MSDPRDEPAAILAPEVRLRLAELGVSARALMRAGYVSRGHMQRLMAGESAPRSLVGLDRGLGWRPGSAAQVVAGGSPSPVLRLRGQQLETPDQIYLDWPRGDGDWRAACEAAWGLVEQRQEGAAAKPSSQNAGTVPLVADAAGVDWLERQIDDWPAWLAERARRVLADADEHEDLAELAERIMALDRASEVIRVLDAWSRWRRAGREDAPS